MDADASVGRMHRLETGATEERTNRCHRSGNKPVSREGEKRVPQRGGKRAPGGAERRVGDSQLGLSAPGYVDYNP